MYDRDECEWVNVREYMVQADGSLWELDLRLLICEMLQ